MRGRARKSLWRWHVAAATLLPLLLIEFAHAANLHQVVLLWPGGVPGSPTGVIQENVRLADNGEHIVSNVHAPSITAYLPVLGKGTGASVIVVPGGGHTELWMDHEGYNVAEFLADHGIAAFVLKYRLARQKSSTYTVEGHALSDLVWCAVRSVQWQLDPARIGVMGFSAGGELVALPARASTAVRRTPRIRWNDRVRGQASRHSSIRPFLRELNFRSRPRPRSFWAAPKISRRFRKGLLNSTLRCDAPKLTRSCTSMRALVTDLDCVSAM